MSDRDRDYAELVVRALAARDRAYAPYSHYHVGSAILADGAIYAGANVENSSFPAGLCAERSALAAAIFAGARALEVVVVATQSSPPAAPCGVCLQSLMEFAPDPTQVAIVLVNPAGERDDTTLAALLPRGFRKRQLDDAT
jgi:cytidine deaminase